MRCKIGAWVLLAALGLFGVGMVGCSDSGEDSCPGKVCSNCSASGDCDVDCSGDQVEYCGHFGLFDDPDLRCAFCEAPDFEF